MDNGERSYRRFLLGDDTGLVELLDEYKDGLILYLRGYVGNIYIAEELAEDTFFRLITKKPRFAGKSSFKSWLYAIGRNVAVDYIRRNRRISVTPPEDMENCLRDEIDLERSYIAEEQKIAVHRALSALPADYKAVLWLAYFEGFAPREVAAILKKSDKQMKNLLYRARQALKTKLEKEGIVYEEF